VSWEDVLHLDSYEKSAGKEIIPEKPREKCLTIEEMISKIVELSPSEKA
jgi:hypothetical protein